MQELSISISQLLGVSSSIATLIAIVIGASWSIYFNRIKEGQKTEFAKQLEILKSKNEKVNYITKAQFDAEFKMYQELSEPIFNMFFDILKLFPMGVDYVPEDETERKNFYEKRYNNAMDNLLIFQKKLYIYAPFIPKHIYDMLDNFRVEARKQVNWYPDFILHPDREIVKELQEEHRKCWKRTEELQKQYKDIIDKLRNHLQLLKIMDDKNE